jgi:uncharacterized membrane protein HdeD (DUF308 family)
MLQYLLGVAMICMGALTIYARVMARSQEPRQPLEDIVPHSHPPFHQR